MKKILQFFILAAAVTFVTVMGVMFFLDKKQKATQESFKIQIEAIKNVVLIADKNLKTWSLVDNDTKIDKNSILATYGDDSAILLKLKKDLWLGLGASSSIRISDPAVAQIDLLYGCYGTRGADKTVAGKYLCSSKNGVFKFLDPMETNTATFISNTMLSPCGELFEANVDGYYSVELSSSGLKSSLKHFQVSTTTDFNDLVFELKTYSNSIKTTMLKIGKYYWRLKGSHTCSFEIAKSSVIHAIKPNNQEIISDGTIEFEWSSDMKEKDYNLTIMSGFSGVAQSVELKTNRYIIDDPLQTLSPGYYFWYVRDEKGNTSTPRSFYIITAQDLAVEVPAKGGLVDSNGNFFPIVWKPLSKVKVYSVAISTSPSFISVEYANTTEQPFVFVPMLKNGDYFLKISALFDNNKKISTDALPFSVRNTN